MGKKRSKAASGPSSKIPRTTSSDLEARSTGPSPNFPPQIPSDNQAMSAGPSTEILRNSPSDVEAMVVEPPLKAASAGKKFPLDALSFIVDELSCKMKGRHWKYGDTDTALDGIISQIFVITLGAKYTIGGCPEALITNLTDFEKNMNVVKKRDPDFVKLLTQAVKENNEELWGRVVIHGTPPDLSWTGLPTAHLLILRGILHHTIS